VVSYELLEARGRLKIGESLREIDRPVPFGEPGHDGEDRRAGARKLARNAFHPPALLMTGKILIGIGIALVVLGLLVQYAPGLLGWFGRLPGDINITRGGSRIFIPITSMIIVSLLLTLIVNLFFRR